MLNVSPRATASYKTMGECNGRRAVFKACQINMPAVG